MAISISGIHYIGKETHELQRVFLGMARANEVYTFYEHDWTDEIRGKLRLVPRGELIEWLSDKGSGLSKSQISKILSGKYQPNPKDRKILIDITRELEEYSSSMLVKSRARDARGQCEHLHVTQSELSRVASISRPTATLFLDDKPVRFSTLKKIEAALDKLICQHRYSEGNIPGWSSQVESSTDGLLGSRKIDNPHPTDSASS